MKLSFNNPRLNLEIKLHIFAVLVIMIAEICFYTPELIQLYSLLSLLGMGLSFLLGVSYVTSKIRLDNFILWSVLIYSIYFFYGLFFLQHGVFSISSMGYRFFGGISLFISIGYIIHNNYRYFVTPFVMAGLFSIFYLIYVEGATILAGGIRLGDTLSGNVNTVGYNFGLIGMLVIWRYASEKNRKDLILFLLFTIFMLVTGSKKTLIILLVDISILCWYNRHKVTVWFKPLLILLIVWYLIFNVSYFYSIIGIRIEQMVSTVLSASSITEEYSYSTDMRERMIVEAWHLFLTKPIFGGGWNYFGANSVLGYEYSHSNFMEMLSSFGLFGTSLYYIKHFYNLKVSIGALKIKNSDNLTANFAILSCALVVVCLMIDWAAVTFSAQIVWYLPIIISCILVDSIIKNRVRGNI